MTTDVFAGIDFDDTVPDVAIMAASSTQVVPLSVADVGPTVICDALSSGSSLGVSFPSVLRLMGTNRKVSANGRSETPDSLVESRLHRILMSIERAAGAKPALVALAVPSSLSENRRYSLLGCAERAKLGRVLLID